ncbi:MAG: sugar phosphate isomerase/epimerase, partial [Candidatus Bathyarchaeia archaeon]
EKYIERAASSIKTCNRGLVKLDISLAVENHGVIANRREFLRGLLKEVGSDNLGLTLDTGNFYWFGYPVQEVYDIIQEFAGHVKHTHIKNATTEWKNERRKPAEVIMAPLYEGDLNLKLIVDALKRTGYDHDLTIEDESLGRFPLEERRKILKKDADFLRSLLG